MNSVVYIAGAHRSGTSMLARLLHRCGLYLGEEQDLMPAAVDNPDGFWEHLRFVHLNDEILSAAGAAWDLPPFAEENFELEKFAPQRAKAQLLIETFEQHPVWGWKDPRNCLTFRFWRSLLPNLTTAIMVRNPLEAAYSMHKRNGTSYALGLRLWEIYHRRLLADTQSQRWLITNYEAFFENPGEELHRIAEFVGLKNADIESATALVARTRRHTHFTIEQMIDAGVSPAILDLYRGLISGNGSLLPNEKRTATAPNEQRNQLAGARSQLNTRVPESEDVRRELAKRRGDELAHREQIARLEERIEKTIEERQIKTIQAAAEIGQRDGRILELQNAYAHLDRLLLRAQGERNRVIAELEKVRADREVLRDSYTRELQIVTAERDKARKDFADVERELNEARGQFAETRARFLQTNELLRAVSVQRYEIESENVSLVERLRKQLIDTKKLVRLLDQVADAASHLRRSRRWRLANPFAWLRALFTGRPAPGFGHLDKNVERYQSWRAAHPEVESLAGEIQTLRPLRLPTITPSPPNGVAQSHTEERLKPPAPTSPIEFKEHTNPEISIIIPVYNQIDFTRACLSAVQHNSGDISYEVIVVDDGSSDSTAEILGKIPGLTYQRAAANEGFTASCNRGAQGARGKYLVFLNNDTTVKTGWLTALRETFDLEPEAGLVGSKLIYPDGRLQEAGGIIWRDGSGWNRGKFKDPAVPEYNYARVVDYCSAASVMISKPLFDELGGFDRKYTPAYYEDTDLAFKVTRAGYKVVYQPLSVVIHYEGMTGGTDITTGAKKHQEINLKTFADRWADVLSQKPENGDVQIYESLPAGTFRILVIDHHLPFPDRDSGSLRMSQILVILAGLGHRVTFIPDNLAEIPPYGDNLRKCGIEVMHHPYLKSVSNYLEENGVRFDIVVLSRRDFAAKHLADVRRYAPQAKLIFDTVDLHFLRELREAELVQNESQKARAAELKGLEYRLIEQADETWVVSEVEQALLHADFPDKAIEVVSNIVPINESPAPFAGRRDLLFVGSFLHHPNIDAVIYFVRDILPKVTAALPGVKCYVIGDKAPPEIIELASEEVVYAGHQPDLRPYFDSVKLSVAPLRYGAGVKGKVNQSMGLGVPVVATSLAVEGMSLTNREDALIVDQPEAFAEAVLELYGNESFWNKLSRNGLEKTRAHFSAATARKQLERLLAWKPNDTSNGKLRPKLGQVMASISSPGF